MKINVLKRTTAFLAAVILWAFAPLGSAQDKPANNMESVHEKLKADKKLIVTKYMELTEAEAKNFWPVYEEYQKDLQKIDLRQLNLLQSYAADYRNQSLTDEKAKQLLDEWIAIDNDDAKRRASYVPKVMKALPAKKASRYLQKDQGRRQIRTRDGRAAGAVETRDEGKNIEQLSVNGERKVSGFGVQDQKSSLTPET